MMKKTRYLFWICFVFFFFAMPVLPKGSQDLKIDSPLKAAVFYFPSPGVMRCLNHSDIPRTLRKAYVHREINFIGQPTIEENITVTTNSMGGSSSRFGFIGNVKTNGEISTLKINGGPFFDLSNGSKANPLFLFRLENLVGVQRKIHILDMIGNQDLNFEVFLRTTKGMIGNLDYKLDLFGQDKVVNGAITYFLGGNGNIGESKIFVFGREVEKDSYYLREDYGRAKVITNIRIYD